MPNCESYPDPIIEELSFSALGAVLVIGGFALLLIGATEIIEYCYPDRMILNGR